jgi:hypothetical protein
MQVLKISIQNGNQNDKYRASIRKISNGITEYQQLFDSESLVMFDMSVL